MTDSALDGVRVVDLSEGIAGPYASKLLAGLGAEVIKVEPPEGDVSRRGGPYLDSAASSETPARFLFLNTGKQSVTLHLDTDAGRAQLLRLCESAGILIESFGPGGLEARGLAPDLLRRHFPRLIVLRISDFGQDGPYSGFAGAEIVLQALGGLLSLTGDPDKAPLLVGGHQAQYLAGLNAFVALTGSLLGRGDEGTGCLIDCSVMECVVAALETATYRAAARGEVAVRDGNWANRAAWGIYPCADGHVAVVSGDGLMFRRMGGLIPALADPRYDSYEDRRAFADEINAQILVWLASQGKEAVAAAGQQQRLPFGAVRDAAELLSDPHLHARGFFERLDHPSAGTQCYPRAPFRMRQSGWKSGPAPLLGEHNQRLTDGPAAAPASVPGPTRRSSRGLPLRGARVLDLSMVWAGPFAAKFLADFGADVIKVESLQHVDSRLWAGIAYRGADPDHPPYARDGYVILFSRNKRAITLDLASPRGREHFLRLVCISDVVLENFSLGVMDRLNLGYDVLRTVNPRVIMASMPSFGMDGPDATKIAYGTTLEALSGLASITGYSAGEPHKSGINYGDPVAGMHAAGAILAALHRLRRTGRGEQIEVAQLESLAMLLGEAVLECSLSGRPPQPAGNADRRMAPHGVYACAGEDRWISIAIAGDAEWQRLACLMGKADWANNPERNTREARLRNAAALDAEINAWTREQDQIALMQQLQAAGIRAGSVLNAAQILADPHLQERGLFASVRHPDGSVYPLTLNPWLCDGAREPVRSPAPALGQDNDAVLGDLLGLTRTQLDDLNRAQISGRLPVVGQPPALVVANG